MRRIKWFWPGVVVYGLGMGFWLQLAGGEWLGWMVGLWLGANLIWVDRLVYVYLTQPQEQLSVYLKHLIMQRRWLETGQTLYRRGHEQRRLVTVSGLFLLVWLPVAVYVVTSSGSLPAAGLVMGAGLRTAGELVDGWRDKAALKTRLFWQIRRPVSTREFNWLVGLWLAGFILLSLAMR